MINVKLDNKLSLKNMLWAETSVFRCVVEVVVVLLVVEVLLVVLVLVVVPHLWWWWEEEVSLRG